jgi:hypothetical protein
LEELNEELEVLNTEARELEEADRHKYFSMIGELI